MSSKVASRSSLFGAALLAIGSALTVLAVTPGAALAQVPQSWSGDYYLPVRAKEHTEHTRVASVGNGDATDSADKSDESDGSDRQAARAYRAKRSARVASKADDEAAPARRRRKAKGVRVASLGNYVPSPAKPRRSLSGGGGIHWIASAGCLNGHLRSILADVASRFGSVTVNSTCRSHSHNAAVGGAPRSMHLSGNAVDFRIHGNYGAAASYMRGQVGGFKHYGGGLFHIDTGPKRTW